MQSSEHRHEKITEYYTTAIDALCEIAHTYFFRGRLSDALRLLRASLDMIEGGEVAQKDRFKLLLLYEQILIVNHLVQRGEPDLMLATSLQVKQMAEEIGEQQSIADALSVLGQARTTAATIAIVKSGALPFGTQGQGKYEEALAYLQQALGLQEELHDSRGSSEALFGIGLIYQFWQQNDLAREHFKKAIQVAEQYGHELEQAEPNRHLTMDALFRGDLEQALIHAQRALSFREAGGFMPYQPLDHLLLKNVYQAKGDLENAQLHEQRAVALAEEMGTADLVSTMLSVNERMEARQETA